jgi:hypothetical protein
MKVLPPTTALPTAPLSRVHSPEPAAFTSYRACLRWDFGFTCCLCFLHESDLIEEGAEGTGLVWIEHQVPQSRDETKTDEYGNCLLSCRFCNNARVARPNEDPRTGARLLDPTVAAWGTHFKYQGHRMEPADNGDGDAAYTHQVYALAAPRKTAMREARARRVGHFIEVRATAPDLAQQLLAIARELDDVSRKQSLIDAARRLLAAYDSAEREVSRHRVPPKDASGHCACTEADAQRLPAWLADQLI